MQNYPRFKNLEEICEKLDQAEHWGFRQMPRHTIASPWRKIILAAIQRELTVWQLARIIDKYNLPYE